MSCRECHQEQIKIIEARLDHIIHKIISSQLESPGGSVIGFDRIAFEDIMDDIELLHASMITQST